MLWRYARKRFERDLVEESFRVYVTESIRLNGEGKYITEKWRDMVHPKPEMDAKAIVSDVIEKCGLKVIE